MRAQTVAAILLLALASVAGARSGAPLPKSIDCGRYTNMNQPIGSVQRSRNRCFAIAFRSGARAKLITVTATFEGDPITTYYRVLGVRRLEVIVDVRRDRYGGGPTGWFRHVCRRLAASANYRYLQPTRCQRSSLPATLPPRWP